MNRQNHSEPENRFTPEEQQEFLELLAQLSPEQLEELKELTEGYVSYYNNERRQWNIQKMTPIEYRNHLLNAIR